MQRLLCTLVLATTLLAFNSAAVAATAATESAVALTSPAAQPMAAAAAASATLVAQAGQTAVLVQTPGPGATANPSTANDTPVLVMLGTALLVVVFVSLRRRPER